MLLDKFRTRKEKNTVGMVGKISAASVDCIVVLLYQLRSWSGGLCAGHEEVFFFVLEIHTTIKEWSDIISTTCFQKVQKKINIKGRYYAEGKGLDIRTNVVKKMLTRGSRWTWYRVPIVAFLKFEIISKHIWQKWTFWLNSHRIQTAWLP